MNRQEHLEWCKQRAIEICDSGDIQGAYASFYSDMNKHNETRDHIALPLMTQMFFGGLLNSTQQMRHFIEGFN